MMVSLALSSSLTQLAVEIARNLTTKENMPLTIRHYLSHLSKLADQYFEDPECWRDKARQRIYLKDIDCPPVWQDKLRERIPPVLFYLNESTGDMNRSSAMDGFRKGRPIGRAGDLMSSLPPDNRADNLMCYIGHEGTFTPAHREMCASLGQNIMVNASSHMAEDGKPERPGSSIWFMTETKDRHVVSEYWLSVLGHDIEVENHFAQLLAWKKAPFKVYVVEQRPGDFILIPPLAPHQVWNRGTRTMKVAWNRTTVETLDMALCEALPNSRIVCRDEQYKNKSIVYYTLLKYSALIKTARTQIELGGEQASVKFRLMQRDFKLLFKLFKSVMLSEMFAPDSHEHPEFMAYDSNVTCAYCRCNMFNRFLTCKTCAMALGTPEEEPYDVCMDCFCMGRSCACQSNYTWVEQWKWKDLVHRYEVWRAQIVDMDGQMTETTPLPLHEERRYLGKKTLAQVCQEQLKIRPFVDITKPQPVEMSEDEDIVVGDDGQVKKMVKKRSKQWLTKHKRCHFCLHRHPKWKVAYCTNCQFAYCYGALFRAHDMMPLSVMEDQAWKCPHCTRTCNTGACRRDPRQRPYQPKGTLLGHDTKKVADVRSVECLVDFSVSNLNWIGDNAQGPDSTRLLQRRAEADMDKLNGFEDEVSQSHALRGAEDSAVDDAGTAIDDSMIDPVLGGSAPGVPTAAPPAFMGQPAPPLSTTLDSAVMEGYQPDDSMNYESSYYPDLSGEIREWARRSRTRDTDDQENEEIRLDGKRKPKRRKNDEGLKAADAKTASSKQYQKEKERKRLEDAKKQGRFILVAARMKGKSNVVKLKVSRDQLAVLSTRDDGPGNEAQPQPDTVESNPKFILQSDVLPTANVVPEPTSPKAPKSFLHPVEADDDFGARGRSNRRGTRKTKPNRRYEEITIDSDDEAGEQSDEVVPAGRTEPQNGRRISVWLSRKHQGDEEMLTSFRRTSRMET